MSYSPENNPYIPGDPYSYDLKWVADQLTKHRFAEESAEAAKASADDAADSADAASADAADAQAAAIAAQNAANNIGQELPDLVDTWLSSFLTDPTSPPVDSSLQISNAAADSATVGQIFNISHPAYTESSGYYISSSGNKSASTNGRMTNVLTIPANSRFVVDYAVGVVTAIGVIAQVNPDNTYTVLVRNGSSAANTHFSYFTDKQIDVVVSYTGTVGTVYLSIMGVSDVVVAAQNIANLASVMENTVNWQYALDNVLCIGDSLTRGVPPVASLPSPMKQNYPWYLARMINTTVTNAGIGGVSTKEWYEDYFANYDMTNYNAFIIFLGTNSPLTDTLATDVDPYNDYTQYANTQTGCYCKLIENIQAINPNAIIVLVNVYHLGAAYNECRTAINKIATKYALPLVSTTEMDYSVNPSYHGGHNNVHMTKAGYLALAHKICGTLKAYFTTYPDDANTGMTS